MTRYYTFLDGSTSAGSSTIVGITTAGGEYGIGISSSVKMDDLTIINSVGIGTTNPQSALDVRGSILCSQNLNIIGVSTLGVTTTTDLTSQQLNVSGITTLGVTTTTDLTSQQLNVSGISTTETLRVTENSLISGITTFGLSSLTSPASNSQMSFELTSNTTLTVRVKGTDGVVRTGIVTLA